MYTYMRSLLRILHIERTALPVTESIIQTSCLINLRLPLFIAHETTCDAHISLVIPYTPLIFFGSSFLLVLVQ